MPGGFTSPASTARPRLRQAAGVVLIFAALWCVVSITKSAPHEMLDQMPHPGWTIAILFVAGLVTMFTPGRLGAHEGARSRIARSRMPYIPTSIPERSGQTVVRGVGIIRGVEIELMTDTASALARITDACRRAQSSVWIAQLAFDANCTVATQADRSPETLLDAILHAARGSRADGMGADVRILLNSSILLDTAPALQRAIHETATDAATRRRIEIRGMNAFPQVMRAKMAVIDGCEAYLMGSSFVNGYWDAGRQYSAGSANIPDGSGDRPMHDVAVRLTGGAAAELARWFSQTWIAAGDSSSSNSVIDVVPLYPLQPLHLDTQKESDEAGQSSVRVLRTSPTSRSGVATPGSTGETQILYEYLDAIAAARSFIYLENQYFSARPIAAALTRALRSRPDLEVILVLNQNPDITAYRAWQDNRLATEGLLTHPRVGVFSPWSIAPSLTVRGRGELTQLFVHSKVAVIDDEWFTLGTANLDGASLHSYGDDFIRWPGQRVFRGYRNFDLNVAVLDGARGEPATGVVAKFRKQLWAAHLGHLDTNMDDRPTNGWLATWRDAAKANVAKLSRRAAGCETASTELCGGLLLPYVPTARPRAQLRALGIDTRAAGIDLRFDPGTVEVLWSPGWMKKLVTERIQTRA